MPTDAFSIVEITGLQREIHLFDRALPYKGLKAPVEQRHVVRWYPGSKVATMQVLGMTVGDWSLEGTWKTKFLSTRKSVDLRGFETIDNTNFTATAEDLVRAFKAVCAGGQTVDVSWGPETRRGILAVFEPEWDMEEECKWSMTFVWTQEGQEPPRRATVAFDVAGAVRQALDDMETILAQRPRAVAGAEASDIDQASAAVRQAGATFLSALQRVQRATSAAISDAQAVQTQGEILVQASRALARGRIQDLPYYSLTNLDDVVTALQVEVWRHDVAAQSRTVGAEARRASGSVSDRIVPGPLAVVTAREGQTLRALARRYYGNADGAGLIADANGLTSLVPPVGMRLVIPRAPAAGGAREAR